MSSASRRADTALRAFRGAFNGKSSPSHFWWGAFDLACTRFSGRRAPPHQGGIPNCSPVSEPAFYAYAYPEPAGCNMAPIKPDAAFYHPEMREWILPYDAVRRAADPSALIAEFLESTYMAAASLGGWNIADLRSSRHADVR